MNTDATPENKGFELSPSSLTSFFDAITSKYFTFNGRTTRAEFWYFVFYNLVIYLFLIFIQLILGIEDFSLISIYYLFMLIPGLTINVRRLHDAGYSGWFLLVPILCFVLLFFDGTKGENAYGQDPQGRKSETIKHEKKHINNSQSKTNGYFTDIEQLSELYNRGIITKQEFEAKKKKLLDI